MKSDTWTHPNRHLRHIQGDYVIYYISSEYLICKKAREYKL